MDTAPKNTDGKDPMSLLPLDLLRKYLVPALQEGIINHSKESWRGGFKTSDMVDAILRHLEKFYWQGEDIDSDSSTKSTHLSSIACCTLFLLHSLETRPELDDRVGKKTEEIKGDELLPGRLIKVKNPEDIWDEQHDIRMQRLFGDPPERKE